MKVSEQTHPFHINFNENMRISGTLYFINKWYLYGFNGSGFFNDSVETIKAIFYYFIKLLLIQISMYIDQIIYKHKIISILF